MSVGSNQKADDLVTRFLLGELSEAERTTVEERFLADGEFFERLLAAEDSLTDAYLLGRLNDEQRQRVERLLQSSLAQKGELEFTRELISFLREQRPPTATASPTAESLLVLDADAAVAGTIIANDNDPERATPLGLLVAAWRHASPLFTATTALVLLLLSGSLLYLAVNFYSEKRDLLAQRAALEKNTQQMQEKLTEGVRIASELGEQLQIERERRAKVEESLAQLQSRSLKPVMSFFLVPTAFERGGTSKTITLTPNGKRVQFQLEVDQSQRYERYSVTLTNFDGRTLWSNNSLPASKIKQGRLVLSLPSVLLKYDDYRIELKGLAAKGEPVHVADYTFKVRN